MLNRWAANRLNRSKGLSEGLLIAISPQAFDGSRQSPAALTSTRGAKDLRDWLASVEELTTEIEVLGTLLAGDAESGRFKLQDDAENLYEGKGSPELLDGTQLNRLYRARLSVLEATADHIGAVAQRYTLLELRPSSLPN